MQRVNFTAKRVADHGCPLGKDQAFLWDATVPGLGLRVTRTGAKAYIFQGRIHGQSCRLTIGDPRSWSIAQAQEEARRLQRLIDEGKDPRAVAAEVRAAHHAKATAEAARAVTVGQAWATYLQERRPHWGDRHYEDHLKKSQAGGEQAIRGTRGRHLTVSGPLFPLMQLRLCDLTPAAVEAWAATEAKTRPSSARLAWRLLKAFVSWCNEHPTYAGILANNPATTKRTREALGSPKAKRDALQREQLPGWFAAVRALPNPVIAAYLQTVLLTGARPGEILALRWDDINFRWHGMTLRDKVEGERTIPLPPYLASLLGSLPHRSEWVFSSAAPPAGKSPLPISKPHERHREACRVAGIEHLTFNGLRRSFKSLAEWVDCPAGIVAQIMGHKPSATAEKHYTVRPLDLLRVHHQRIEAWILEQAGIAFDPARKTAEVPLATAR